MTDPDADFERRWQIWQARGLARERAARRRLMLVAMAAGPVLAVAIAYGALAS